jgi:hypothetical protein
MISDLRLLDLRSINLQSEISGLAFQVIANIFESR